MLDSISDNCYFRRGIEKKIVHLSNKHHFSSYSAEYAKCASKVSRNKVNFEINVMIGMIKSVSWEEGQKQMDLSGDNWVLESRLWSSLSKISFHSNCMGAFKKTKQSSTNYFFFLLGVKIT